MYLVSIADNLPDILLDLIQKSHFKVTPLAEKTQCFITVMDEVTLDTIRVLQDTHLLNRQLPVVVVTNSYPSSEILEEVFMWGAYEFVRLSALASDDLALAVQCAVVRGEVTASLKTRDAMLTSLCDALPFEMVYRIVKRPGKAAKFVYVSKGIERLSKVSVQTALKNPEALYEVIDPEYRAKVEAAESKAVSDLASFDLEIKKKLSDGKHRWSHVRSIPQRLPDGTIIWDGIETDITAYKDTEEALRESEARERTARLESERSGRMKDEFLATLSHELRTPINAVLGWSQLLRRGQRSAQEIAQAIDIIERNARSQAKLIEDLLDMNRIISGKFQLDMHVVDFFDIVSGAINSISPTAEMKQVTVKLDPPHPSEVLIMGDSARLQQIVWNLLSNAVKFTPQNGVVSLTLLVGAHTLELAVKDSGIGINSDFLPFVFDRFRQADASTTRRYGGLGLGLSIVKHLSELHGGSVNVASEGEGKGATFTVVLPLANLHLKKAVEESSDGDVTKMYDLSDIKALLVEDEIDARQLVVRILMESNAQVTAVETAEEALQQLDRQKFDLIISDIGMPHRDGLWFMKQVRERKNYTPAVALTAFARPEDRKNTLIAGYQMHVPKPVDATELLIVIRALLDRK